MVGAITMKKIYLVAWDPNIYHYCIHLSRFQTSKQYLEESLCPPILLNISEVGILDILFHQVKLFCSLICFHLSRTLSRTMNENCLVVRDLNIYYNCIHLSRFQTSKLFIIITSPMWVSLQTLITFLNMVIWNLR